MESAVARVCREGGGRVATNRMVRDLDLPIPSAGDSRRIEVIVDGLSLFRECSIGSRCNHGESCPS